MAIHQLRLSKDLGLKNWIRQLAVQLEPQIPSSYWPPNYSNKGVRILILFKALREGFLDRLVGFEFCGSQTQCDEACEPVSHNHSHEKYLEGNGTVAVERYQVVARGAVDLARSLFENILKRIPLAVTLGKPILHELVEEISKHLYVNELCGRTDLCLHSSPRDIAPELIRDPGPVEI